MHYLPPVVNTRNKTILFFLVLLFFVLINGPLMSAESSGNNLEKMKVLFFFSPACKMCKETTEAVNRAKEKYNDRVTIEFLDTTKPGNYLRMSNMLSGYKFDKLVTPALNVFCGQAHMAGADSIIDNLDSNIISELKNDNFNSLINYIDNNKEFKKDDRYGIKLDILTVSINGLVDGLNPCAFAGIVLLVSMLSVSGHSRRSILVIGAAYSIAVFITYFFIGYVFFRIMGEVRKSPKYAFISDGIYWLAFISCLLFGVLSVFDSIKIWRSKETSGMMLALPEFLKKRIRKTMRKGVHSSSIFWGAIVAGIVVSFLESACTGQVYFPTLSKISNDSITHILKLSLLLLYNFMFILPLMVIFAATYGGVSSQRIASLGRKHTHMTKLLLALVFFGMALWMSKGL